MRRFTTGCFVILLLAIVAVGQTKTPVKTGKIYVGSFGMGDDAEQLKLALGFELTNAGFKVVDFEPQADTTLTGLIVTRVESGRRVKRVTVFLKDKTGKQVWNQDIGSTSSSTRDDQQGIRQRAQDIARMLKQDAGLRPKKATALPKTPLTGSGSHTRGAQ